MRGAVSIDDADATAVMLGSRRPIPGIGKIEPAVGAKAKVIGSIQVGSIGGSRDDFDLAVRGGALDAGRQPVGRNPAAGGRAIGDVDVAVAAEQARIGSPAGKG